MERIIAEVTPEELRFAMATGTAAASGRTPQSGVEVYGVDVEDTPENRAMVAIRNQFDSGKFKALMARIGAMMAALQDDRALPYIRTSTEGLPGNEVDEAVVDVAATLPLNGKGRFDESEFFRAVAEAVKTSGTN